MAERLNVELTTFTNESATTTAVIICLISPEQARMLPPRQSSFWTMPEPSTLEGQQAHGELRALLERAAV
jgi:hypothetical protein